MSSSQMPLPNGRSNFELVLDRAITVFPYLLVVLSAGTLVLTATLGEKFNVSREDGLLEWGSVFFFAACAVVAAYLRWKADTADIVMSPPARRFLTVFAIVCCVAVGEELSWGQRVFDWTVPVELSAESGGPIQAGHDDISIHNLSFRGDTIRFSLAGSLFGAVLLLGLLAHGVWLPIARRQMRPSAAYLVERWGVFVPPLSLGILIFITATVFHYLKNWIDLTEPREYKELLVPAVYAFILIEAHPDIGDRRRRQMGSVLMCSTTIWLVASGTILYVFR